VVIVGGGLGGIEALRALARFKEDFDITLVEPKDHFTFKPMLYEALNGVVATVPLSQMLPSHPSIRHLRGYATAIDLDPAHQVVQVAEAVVPYDYLILSTGAATNYFGVPGAEAYTLKLETSQDLDRIRQSVAQKLQAAELAESQSSERARNLTFLLVGGGATGIELALELEYYIQQQMKTHHPSLSLADLKVVILEATPDILTGFTSQEKAHACHRLKRQGIDIRYNHQVKAVLPDGSLRVSRKDPSGNLEEVVFEVTDPIWVAGVVAHCPRSILEITHQLGRSGRIQVNAYLELPDFSSVYIIGDVSGSQDPGTRKPLPQTGQAAENQADFVARDIRRKLREQGVSSNNRPVFRYRDKGKFLSLGPGSALVHPNLPGPLHGLILNGLLGSFLRHYYYNGKLNPIH
jgi:NADH dehydrogenase